MLWLSIVLASLIVELNMLGLLVSLPEMEALLSETDELCELFCSRFRFTELWSKKASPTSSSLGL